MDDECTSLTETAANNTTDSLYRHNISFETFLTGKRQTLKSTKSGLHLQEIDFLVMIRL